MESIYMRGIKYTKDLAPQNRKFTGGGLRMNWSKRIMTRSDGGHSMRRSRIALTAAIVSVAMVVLYLPPAGAQVPPQLTLLCPSPVEMNKSIQCHGFLTTSGDVGIPFQTVHVERDGEPIAEATTALINGYYSFQTTFSAPGTYRLQATSSRGTPLEARSSKVVVVLEQPDVPVPAPPIDPTVATTLHSATRFLYSGQNPLQTGVDSGTINLEHVAVLRGRVRDEANAPLGGVTVSVAEHQEYGSTQTRADGRFDMAVNGGGWLTVSFEKPDYLPVHRSIQAPWQDFVSIPEVVMLRYDDEVTRIEMDSSDEIQVARGSEIVDGDESRQATLLVPGGTSAELVFADGSTQSADELDVRATEYTVDAARPETMPAPLPATSAYTYAVELSADQAVDASAASVRFDQPLWFYVENFLDFPVGGPVPTAYYDLEEQTWVPSDDGRILSIVGVTGGRADLDVDGDGDADTGEALEELGVTDAERSELASLYTVGQSLWRVSMTHFTVWDHNWPFRGPAGAVAPSLNPEGNVIEDGSCESAGSIIECQNQVLGESIGIAGTPFSLNYRSDRVPGGRSYIDIPLSGETIPPELKRIELDVAIAGTRHHEEFPAAANQSHRFHWDRKDAYGRIIQGAQPATITVTYVYRGGRYCEPREFQRTFGQSCVTPTDVPLRGDVMMRQTWRDAVGPLRLRNWDARGLGFGGWSLDIHHVYDPGGRILYLGDGRRRSAQEASRTVITSVAPHGAAINGARSVSVDNGGNLYIADTNNHRIRKVDSEGTITTLAGDGVEGSTGDGEHSLLARFAAPHDVAVAGDGSLYVADTRNHKVRRISPSGIITTVAGTGEGGFGGDGGSATGATLNSPTDVELDGAGGFFIADSQNHRIRYVDAAGSISTIAGNGMNGFAGDGGSAGAARLNEPHEMALGSGGTLFIADSRNNRIRRVSGGVITTYAGNGSSFTSGNGGPATNAGLGRTLGVDVGPDGSVYISTDLQIRRVDSSGIIRKFAGGNDNHDGGPADETKVEQFRGGVTVTPEGVVYIASDRDHLIRRVDESGTISTAVGTFTGGFAGDNGPATSWRLRRPEAIAVAPDGTMFIVDTFHSRVLKVAPDGSMERVAGTVECNYTGDGGPAVDAMLCHPTSIALSPNGDILIADWGNNRIRKVDSEGIITTVAGNGEDGYENENNGDGGPATEAVVPFPEGIAVSPDGSLYVPDSSARLRKVSSDGIITTMAGTGGSGFSGDGGPAVDAEIGCPMGVATGPDGGVYVSDYCHGKVRRIDSGGIIDTVAGNSDACVLEPLGDGGQATEASLCSPNELAVSPGGELFIADASNDRIRRVDTEGVITTIAGGGNTDPSFVGDAIPAAAAVLSEAWGVALDPGGSVYIADKRHHRIRHVGLSLEGFDGAERLIPSEDGAELFVFDPEGRHLRTLDALTGVVLYRFGYDNAGRLVTIEDRDGNQTQIERNGSGNATEVRSPYGLSTQLVVGADGYLSSITNPLGESLEFVYEEGGLLTELQDARGNTHTFAFNGSGRLIRDEGPDGTVTQLSRSGNRSDYTVTETTAEGLVTTYRVVRTPSGKLRQITTAPSGATTESTTEPDGTGTTVFPDGTRTQRVYGPDPRWGLSTPLLERLRIELPSGKSTTTRWRRAVSLSNPDDLLALDRFSEATTTGGATDIRTFSASDRTISMRSAGGRLGDMVLDEAGRVIRLREGDLAPQNFSYDSRGRLAMVSHGSGEEARSTSMTYGAGGFLDTVTNSLNETTSLSRDDTGQVTNVSLADLNEILFSYDSGGNLTSLTPPGRSSHGLEYTGSDRRKTYTPPTVEGGGVTTYSYDSDLRLSAIDPPGAGTIDYSYDTSGRLAATEFSRGSLSFAYVGNTSRLQSLTAPGGELLALSYDGHLVTSTESQGTNPATVSYGYDSDLRIASRAISGETAILFRYDDDGLMKSAGGMTLERDPITARLISTTLGNITTSQTHNTFGELAAGVVTHTDTATAATTSLYETILARDSLGRIETSEETVGGVTSTYAYSYDNRGRLTDVTKGGAPFRSYTYDANGNRLTATEDAADAVTGTYDAQDRLASYGDYTYTYTPDGQLRTKTVNDQTTSYAYDELGNLMEVALPNKVVSYVIDGLGRRVAKKVNGSVTDRFVYGQGIQPIAELNSSGGINSEFIYASKEHVPDLLIKSGTTYRLLHDQLGSVRLVVNISTGDVVQRIDYDPYGEVLNDTNPGFQPFGFAGGIFDHETGLVRFGSRDYDAQTGRWTAKDSLLFEGGDPNLYAYVGNDSINNIDPRGLDWLEDLNDSVGGVVDGLTTIPFTDFSLMGTLRDHMVEGGIAVDVNECSWGYGYAEGIGGLVQSGLFVVSGASAASRGGSSFIGRFRSSLSNERGSFEPFSKHPGPEMLFLTLRKSARYPGGPWKPWIKRAAYVVVPYTICRAMNKCK